MENKRVFVSPSVHTSERDLTFVTNNVGVTTLGLVGETLKGPAFQPIFISNYGEMKSFFGGQNPKKNKDTGFLQYELPYIAKSYLQNSNQLYVTRVLGLSGYDAGTAFTITANTAGAVDESTAKDIVILRSRASYDGNTATFAATTITVTGTTVRDEFDIVIDAGDPIKVSLDPAKKNYIIRVLGRSQEDGKAPVYVEEIYPKLIKGLEDTDEIGIKEYADQGNYKTQYRSAKTPFIVSEVIGNDVKQLFRFETISDGNSANEDVKVSITNIRPDERTFDVEVRKFNDTDANPVVLERFSKCTMNPKSRDFVGNKIGTVDGDFVAISSYVLVEFPTEADDTSDSFPAGYEGYVVRDGMSVPTGIFDTAYGEFENKRRKYLGVTESMDVDLLNFKGLDAEGKDFTNLTKGFHMDINAPADFFEVGAASFQNESELVDVANDNPYAKTFARKFTVAPAGGFDGWDIYRTSRTTGDAYSVQRMDPLLVGEGLLFEKYELTDGDTGINSDYYAFLEGARTLSNPRAFDVNIITTPGIDLVNNRTLSEYVIDMVERERGDCIYIATLPDTSYKTKRLPQEVAMELGDDFDSNYTATYWPWIQKFDDENGVNIFLPPTGEVVKNIALTDNVAYPWYATAGFKFGKVEAKQARIKLTQVHSDALYGNRINPITTFAGDGIKIMGNKNLQVADTALNRLNVRRLLLQARKLISNVGVRLLFDQNDGTIREEFLRKVNPILDNMRKERGLHNFKVELDPISPEGNDRNTLNGRIRIQPTDALEYINISFDVTQNGASFEDI